MIPTPLPPESVYTSCYCEENIYLLCQEFFLNETLRELWEIFAVFISNANKTVALWCQKAARFDDAPVFWDYHVILVLRPRKQNSKPKESSVQLQSWVYDFDTRLPIPCEWKEYLDMTFPEGLLSAYASQFRVIPGDLFFQHFASDRSHMLVKLDAMRELQSESTDALYSSPPPPYAPICGPGALQAGITNNLMSNYVAMVEKKDCYGVVFDRAGVDQFFTAQNV